MTSMYLFILVAVTVHPLLLTRCRVSTSRKILSSPFSPTIFGLKHGQLCLYLMIILESRGSGVSSGIKQFL